MIPAVAFYLGLVLAMSTACFVAYGLDKRRAVRGDRRIPERTLHILAFLGGWPGALGGRRFFRHKTKKPSFLIVSWLVVVLHVAIFGAAAYGLWNATRSVSVDRRGPIIDRE